MVTFSNFYVGFVTLLAATAPHRRVLLNGFCRTRRVLQNSTGFAELDGSCRTRRVLQDSTVLAELDGFCRTRRFLQNLKGFAELDGPCRTRRVLQDSTFLAELDGFCRTRRFLQDSTCFAVSSPFWPLRTTSHSHLAINPERVLNYYNDSSNSKSCIQCGAF